MSTTLTKPLLTAVESFLGRAAHGSFVGGKPLLSNSGSTIPTYDPGSGTMLADVSALTADEVDRAVDVANDAFKNTAWATMPVNERSALLHRQRCQGVPGLNRIEIENASFLRRRFSQSLRPSAEGRVR